MFGDYSKKSKLHSQIMSRFSLGNACYC